MEIILHLRRGSARLEVVIVSVNNASITLCQNSLVNANCQHEYSMTLLDQVLSPKLNKRANDRIFREEMKKAGIGSGW